METPNPTARDVDELVRSAHASLQTGRLDAAEALCRDALAQRPRHLGALSVLGGVLHSLERFSEAQAVYEEMTSLAPDEPVHWMNLGTARRSGGKLDAALAAFARAAELGCRSADFYFNLGLTHLDRLDYESAHAVLARAMALAPEDAQIRFEFARACNESNRSDEAAAALENWQQLQGLDPALTASIGQQWLAMGEPDRASDALRALPMPAGLEPRAALTLAQIFERTNRVSEAAAVLSNIRSDPRSRTLGMELERTEAQVAQRESRHEEAVNIFSGVLRRSADPHKRHFDLFPLARSLDALGRHDEAFAALEEAHRSQLAHIKLVAPLVAARGAPMLAITQYGCDPQDVRTWSRSNAAPIEESPIFVVGFPRSGTTLLELTLDAHPALASMDEQPFLQNAIDELQSAGVRYPEKLGSASDEILDAARARYWERARRKVRLEPGQRLVDKNPLNLLRLPAIRRLFPAARIVLVARHPCDVLMSCYMQHFTAPDFAMLCLDLPTLADGYRRSFDFWFQQSALLEPTTLELRYEHFVADFDKQARALARFLELEWDDAMLEPGKHARSKAYISTPSYSQVVQPVSGASVGRAKPYARHLDPVIPRLEPYLARWGYEWDPAS